MRQYVSSAYSTWDPSLQYTVDNIPGTEIDIQPVVVFSGSVYSMNIVSPPPTPGVTPPTGGSGWTLVITSNVGTGTVTNVTGVATNGFTWSIATSTSTPAITLGTSIAGILKGVGGALTLAAVGVDYSAGTSALATGIIKSTTTTGEFSIAVAGDFPTLNQSTTGNAATATLAATATAIAGGAANQLVYQSGTGATTFTASVANALVTTNGSNVPALVTTIPTANLETNSGYTATLVGWTEVGGAPTVTANYVKQGSVIQVSIRVVPATTVATTFTTSTVALPFTVGTVSQALSLADATTGDALGSAIALGGTLTLTLPTIAATASTLLISGSYSII